MISYPLKSRPSKGVRPVRRSDEHLPFSKPGGSRPVGGGVKRGGGGGGGIQRGGAGAGAGRVIDSRGRGGGGGVKRGGGGGTPSSAAGGPRRTAGKGEKVKETLLSFKLEGSLLNVLIRPASSSSSSRRVMMRSQLPRSSPLPITTRI